MPTRYFYSDLPVLTDFVQITDHHNFVAVPDDWLIMITDIIGSTRAIEQGRYKDVNLLGACSIVSVLNLECRWQDIPSRYGETVSLLVLATHDEEYRDVIEQIQLIYGAGDRHNPITRDRRSLSLSPNTLLKETKVRTPTNHRFSKLKYLIKIQFENLLGWIFMKFKLNVGGTDWGKYQDVVAAATDYCNERSSPIT